MELTGHQPASVPNTSTLHTRARTHTHFLRPHIAFPLPRTLHVTASVLSASSSAQTSEMHLALPAGRAPCSAGLEQSLEQRDGAAPQAVLPGTVSLVT